MSTGRVMTVRGPVPAPDLGVTLMHEHVFIDLSILWDAPTSDWQKPLVDAEISLANRGLLQVDPYVSRRTLLLDDFDVAGAELAPFRQLGGGSIVDLTTTGIRPQPAKLREVSERTGLHIVAGCGYYTQRAHPPEVATLSESELLERLLDEIANGLEGTDVRPGIIGEIGTSSPVHPDEAKFLRVAAAAQGKTGLAINVHVAIFRREALAALDILETAGADLSRVVISHLDVQPDTAYHQAILERGAYVEFDTFGSESYFDGDGSAEPSDRERVDCLIVLLEAAFGDRLLISQDVCAKVQLLMFGGLGYGHILRSILPRLRRRGVDEATVRRLLVENPARVLATAS